MASTRRRRSPGSPGRARDFFDTYTKDLTAEDLQRLFTRDTREAYEFFTRGIDPAALPGQPLFRRLIGRLRLVFLAFTLKLSPARRVVYGIALVLALVGMAKLFRGVGWVSLPIIPFIVEAPMIGPVWREGTLWLFFGFLLLNLLVLVEVADRLTLKNDLEVARQIQQAMLPRGTYQEPGVKAAGRTRPANTVGGDFYDILPLADGRIAVALGDVAGKGSPAAMLMALLLAMLRTLADEKRDPADLLARLNSQVMRHAPGTRFITLFLAFYDPITGDLHYVNAGHLPPLVRRGNARFEHLTEGGVALGLFEHSEYVSARTRLEPGDLLVLYSDGLTEAEDRSGQPFEESGLSSVIETVASEDVDRIGTAAFDAVLLHSGSERLADDLTILVLRREVVPIAEPASLTHSGV
jgi:sigma-B regulation protein RsbU (phosphoserine phosphatase)